MSNPMNLALAADCLAQCVQANIPAFLWGPPGVGKSEVIDQVAARLDMAVIDFRASLRDAVDLRGLPLVDAKTSTTRWLPPGELPNEKRDGKRGILKLDELNVASQSVQAACFGLVLERRLGEYEMPRGWVPIAAGNRISDRAAAQRVPSALLNRFAHFEVEADVATWCSWAAASGIEPLVIAFIRYRPELLHRMPTADDRAFPTPRAWASVSKIAAAPDSVRLHLATSIVGEAPAGEFEAFARVFNSLPSVQSVLRDPKGAKCPGVAEPAACYAISAALARHATASTFDAALTYARRMTREFEVLIAVDAVKRDPALMKTKAFGEWAARNGEVVL